MMSGKNIGAVYAFPDEQTPSKRSEPEWVTAGEAIKLCGIFDKYPELEVNINKQGDFGKLADTVRRDKDRIENRPLLADSKEVCRERAEEGKFMTKVDGDISAVEA